MGGKQKIAYFYDSAWAPGLLSCAACVCVLSKRSHPIPIHRPASHPCPHPAPGDYAGFYYGVDHPMKPQRISMAHDLILGYGLHEHMDVYVRDMA